MTNDTSSSQQTLSTPNRPVNRNRHSKSSPQVPIAHHQQLQQQRPNNRQNNKGNRKGNFHNANNGNSQQRHESALTRKFREAAHKDQGATSDSAINSVMDKGLVTPPATPGPTVHTQPGAYASDSALGSQTDGQGKKKNRKKRGRRPTDIYTNAPQSLTPPQDASKTPPETQSVLSPTPMKKYAGACFHSSPAPGALPMPKFFSKSLPAENDGPSLSKMLAEAEAAGMPDASVDSPPPSAPLPINADADGPLNIFFKADREEKARKALGSNSQLALNSPNPKVSPPNNAPYRNITPPSAAPPTGLGSPFGDKLAAREDQENSDLLFNMEFPDSKKNSLRPAEEVMVGPRFRPLNHIAYDPEAFIKRQEKAQAMKAALLNQQQSAFQKSLDIEGPPSPSPKSKPRAVTAPQPSDVSNPLSPPLFERRAAGPNVGFAPAPRIRHFNQNRPVSSRRQAQDFNNQKSPVISPGFIPYRKYKTAPGHLGWDQVEGETPIPAV